MHDSVRARTLILPVFVAIGLAGCGDTTEPRDFSLPDEMAIHAVINDRMSIFGYSSEANAVLRYALGSPVAALDELPGGWTGSTRVYDEDSDTFVADGSRPMPDNVARVIWYGMAGDFVASPVEERGHVDLADRDHANLLSLDVTAVRAGDPTVTAAEYRLTAGETSSATSWSELFEAEGSVRDDTRQLMFHLRNEQVEPVTGGTESSSYSLSMSAQGLQYAGSVEESRTAAAAETADIVVAATVDGVPTRVELQVQSPAGGVLQGSGTLRHDGQHLADIAMAGGQMSFTPVDGGSYSNAQQQRLGTLVVILLNPMTAIQTYFW